MVCRAGSALFATVALASCASYQPAPISSADLLADFSSRQLDRTGAQTELARIAPGSALEAKRWDRLALLAEALAHNPSIVEAKARAQSAQAASRASRAGPSLSLTLTAEYAGKASEASPWLYGIAGDIPLDLRPRRNARIRSADAAAVTSSYEYLETVWATRMEIRRALAEQLLVSREIVVGEELSAIRARQLAALTNRFEAGEATRAHLERVRTEAAADGRRLSDARGRLITSRAGLADALGVSQAAVTGADMAWDDFLAPTWRPDDEIAAVRREALLARADILRAAGAYDQADAELRAAVVAQYPDLRVGPGYTWERGLVKLPFAIGLTLPPIDLAHNGVRAAEAHRTEAGAHLEAVVGKAQNAIDTALAERVAARDALSGVRAVDLRNAQAAATQADQELREGAIDRVDWSAAQVSRLTMALAEIDALRRVHAADAALEDALRRPLEGPELAVSSLAPGVVR